MMAVRTAVAFVAAVLITMAPLAARDAALGQVMFGGRPVPGASVVASKGERRVTLASDADGAVSLDGLDAGEWAIAIDMPGFRRLDTTLVMPIGETPPVWTLELVSAEELMRAHAAPPPPRAAPAPAARQVRAPVADDAPADTDGFLVNGSVNNAAASPFAQPRGFGNNRPEAGSLYNGLVGLSGGTSRWDARPYSFGGTPAPVPAYNDVQFAVTFGGPVKPWRAGAAAPRFVVSYLGSDRRNATTESLVVPTALERAGDFSRTVNANGAPVRVINPFTGQPFDGNVVPADRINGAAASLLALYPLPNVEADSGSNYQAAVTTAVRQDDFQSRVTHVAGRNIYLATLALQRSSSSTRNAFRFDDRASTTGIDALGSWNHRFGPRFAMRFRYQFTRVSSRVTPFFAGRVDVSGEAGITGNDRDPATWGPPQLVFPDIARLSDVLPSQSVRRVDTVNVETYFNRGRHTLTFGGDIRRHAEDAVAQRDPRGTFTFTGDLTGVPFADFLLGLPATSGIGFGNSDKQFRSRSFDLYLSDDARLTPTLTVTAGLRWEFETPVTEALGRLANIDVAPGFTSASTVTSGDSIGSETGRRYGAALVNADWRGLQPRLAFGWRPVAGSSLTIRGGYGIYRNNGLYPSLAAALAGQPPFSKTGLAEQSADAPLTLEHGFASVPADALGTVAVDPALRVGYLHTWQISAQRELPASLFVVVSYLGSRGQHLLQQILPNTYPPGAANPCASCPAGFAWLTSDGRSTRHAMQVNVRRRLRAGLAASATYTLARAFDDAATFNPGVPPAGAVAQDWLDPEREWGPSSFDQRHLLTAQVQFTSGIGAAGGARLDGWIGRIVKGWTIASDVTAGSSLPLTPIYLAAIRGSGFVGVRPDFTGAPIDAAPEGAYANASAFTAPVAGAWGTAGRNSMRGAPQFRADLSVARLFAWGDRRSVESRVDVTNVFNVVTFASVYTTVGSPAFGFPSVANPMRKTLLTIRVRF